MNFVVPLFDINDCARYAGKAQVVYAGLEHCSVRCVTYFTWEQLREIAQACRTYGLKLAVALNRFFLEEDLAILKDALKLLKELDVSRIYYSDESVLWQAMQEQMQDRLVYAPETLVTNHQDALYYCQEGIAGVVLSKDITLQEMCAIAAYCPGRCEAIIHGRVNIMHSRRNLLSSYMEFIGKDIPVKDRYDLYLIEEKRNDHMPIVEDSAGTHVFSGYTLMSFNEIRTMRESGIAYYRIEGLFHDIEYVLEALDLYHQVMNGEDPQVISCEYAKKYASDQMSDGFYHQATSKVKEG